MKSIFLPRLIVILALTCLTQLTLLAQPTGRIAGKVLDANGKPIPNASIKLTSAKGGIITDIEGRFSLAVPAGNNGLQVIALGYTTKKVEDIAVKAGQVENLDIVLQVATNQLEGVVVKASSARRESAAALISFQKNTNTVAQVVSAEAIRKSPDRNTSEVLKRVPGASIQEGKYLVIRGLADRYNAATLNGALLSSTEPDRKTFAFDIFPSNIIDNIIINKAALPELSGEFAGGLVQITTKDVVDKNFFNISLGTGFNTQVINNQNIRYSSRGALDFLGVDDGTRWIPQGIPSNINGLSNGQRADVAKTFNNDWSTSETAAPLNYNFQMAGGFTKALAREKKFGGIFSLTYNRQNRVLPPVQKRFADFNDYKFDFIDNEYSNTTLAGAIANFVLQSPRYKISLKNSYSINGSDKTLLRTGLSNSNNDFIPNRGYLYLFRSSMLLNNQLTADFASRDRSWKFKVNGNFAWLNQDVPDLRNLNYSDNARNGIFAANLQIATGNPRSVGRFYSTMYDLISGGGADAAKAFKWKGFSQALKFGALYQNKVREFNSRVYSYAAAQSNLPQTLLGPDQIFAPENFSATRFFLFDNTSGSNQYSANSNLMAAYVQLDNQFSERLKINWGVRMEAFDQVISFRKIPGLQNSLNVVDFLPSMNATYKLNQKTNLRLSASQTVARPEFREVSIFSFYDYEKNGIMSGNPNLRRTKITNLDLRYELYPSSGELFTVGAFYKDFTDAIEPTVDFNAGGLDFKYQNAPKARTFGVETDFRKRFDFVGQGAFWNNLTVTGNLAWISSDVDFKGLAGQDNRPMQGQSNYVLNAGLLYDNPKTGTSISGLFNRVGRRILLASAVGAVWENPRSIIDFTITQRIAPKMELRFTVSDLLNQAAIFYIDRNNNKKYDGDITILNPGVQFSTTRDVLYSSFKPGTNVGLTFNYTF